MMVVALFSYYLKELEFRYNNRNDNLFERLLEILGNVEYIKGSLSEKSTDSKNIYSF